MLPILTYHSIDNSGSVISVSIEKFKEQMRFLKEAGYSAISISDLTTRLSNNNKPGKKEIVITFDDGFKNVYTHAFPVLRSLGFTATVFIVTDYCGEKNYWDKDNIDIPRMDLLEWGEIIEMHKAGIEFGAHTCTHPDLSTISTEQIKEEMKKSKETLEERLNVSIKSFAYPYGIFNEEIRREAGGLFSAVCSTKLAYSSESSDPLALPRIDMFYFSGNDLFRYIGNGIGKIYITLRSILRQMKNRASSRNFNVTKSE